jgi:hypothetical protein
MAAKRQNSAGHSTPQLAQIVVDESWRSRVNKPTVTDPKKRREAVERATSLIKTTARIDTISPGQE